MDEERHSNGMTIKGLLIRIILIIIFIVLLMWLFPMPNLKPLNNQIFSDNIERMRDVAKSYYTVDRLPKNISDSKAMTLQEMLDSKLILPLMDSNGKYCSASKSYVKITKEKDEYVMKIYLSCSDKKDYIIVHYGCYDICSDKCKAKEETGTSTTVAKTVTTKKGNIYEYEFSKNVCTQNFDKYVCASGYTLDGSKCIKSGSSVVTVAANEHVTNESSVDTKSARAVVTDNTKVIDASSSTTTETSVENAIAHNKNTGAIKTTKTEIVTADKINSYDVKGAIALKKATIATYIKTQNYDIITATKIATSAGWTYDYTRISYSPSEAYENANAKLVYVGSFTEAKCPSGSCSDVVTKYKYYHYVKQATSYTYSCDNFSGYSLYNGKYCRKATSTSYSCPSGYTDTGSNCKKSEVVSYSCSAYGSDYKLDSSKGTCTKTTSSYSCPAGTSKTSDASKCSRVSTSYSCPAGTSKTSDSSICAYTVYSCPVYAGAGTTTTLVGSKCIVNKQVKSYSCPTGSVATTDQTKCAVKSSNTTYTCSDYAGYALSGTKCTKTTTTQKKSYSCNSGYTLNGTTCMKTVDDTKIYNADATYTKSCSTNYMWATTKSVNGWTYTGNSRLVK